MRLALNTGDLRHMIRGDIAHFPPLSCSFVQGQTADVQLHSQVVALGARCIFFLHIIVDCSSLKPAALSDALMVRIKFSVSTT